MPAATDRYPFTPYPKGWFCIAESEEIQAAQVKPIFYFGRHLVLFRTDRGTAVVLDAHCAHQGAHLGHGGKVVGETIRCPYHGWGFDRSGNCTSKPFQEAIQPDNRIARWAVLEVDERIFVHYDPDRNAPAWNISAQPNPRENGWKRIQRRVWTFRSHPQEIGENLVDAAHFQVLHRTGIPHTEFESDGVRARVSSRLKLYTKKGEADARLSSIGQGLGYWILRYSGIVETMVLATITPVDGEKQEFRFEFLVNGDHDLGKRFTDSIAAEVDADVVIWENKIYRENPPIGPSDGPIRAFRDWCRQFY